MSLRHFPPQVFSVKDPYFLVEIGLYASTLWNGTNANNDNKSSPLAPIVGVMVLLSGYLCLVSRITMDGMDGWPDTRHPICIFDWSLADKNPHAQATKVPTK